MANQLFPDDQNPISTSTPASVTDSGVPAPSSGQSPATGITPLNTTSNRTLLPDYTSASPTPSTTPASATNAAPASSVNTAPVVAAPVMGSVDSKSTVAGQIRELLSAGNPYVEDAKQRALQFAGARGLQNSSIAAQSGEAAATAAAAPIAAQDATTFANQSLANQNAQNQFGLNAQQIQGQSQLQKEASLQKMAEAAMAGDIQSKQMLEQAGYNFQLSAQDNVNKLQQLAAQGDVNAKLALQQFGFQQTLLQQEGALKLGQITAQGDQSARLAELDATYKSMLMDKEAGINLTLEDKRFQQQQQLLVSEYAQRLGLTQADSALQMQRMTLQHTQTLEQIAAQAQATKIADYGPRLQAQYLASVSERMNSSSAEISNIYSQQGLSSAQQQAAVQTAYTRLNQDLASLASFYQQSPLWDPAWGQNAPTPAAPAPTDPSAGPTIDYGQYFNGAGI